MPVYISLMKWTSQGLGGLPAWRDRIEEGERAIEERGGKLLDAYVTLGRFDLVEIFEAPDDETAYQCLVAVARHGTVTTETLRAFTREEAESIVRSL
ncbi:MAG TPA: GYD domain-containing protein [Gaiellaceae bacterium]|nr:GYD domain-containing protein [Gaiellaceae bacterium]